MVNMAPALPRLSAAMVRLARDPSSVTSGVASQPQVCGRQSTGYAALPLLRFRDGDESHARAHRLAISQFRVLHNDTTYVRLLV